MDNQGRPEQRSITEIDAFGGLAAAGINASFRKIQHGVTITRSPPGEGRRIIYAVSVNLRDGVAIDIATHVKLGKIQDLANAVAKVLSIDVVDAR